MMMEERERIVLQTLEKIHKQNVVLIGGFAVNAYVPPWFSIDCDLVVLDGLKKIEDVIADNGFVKAEEGDVPYGNYVRYFRNNEKVSFDLLVSSVLDRDTGVVFEEELFRKYSALRVTVGRTNLIRIEMKIADSELLFAMKFVTARKQDIRDLFMFSSLDLEWDVIADILSEKCGSKLIKSRIRLIRNSIQSKGYRDSLQGPYGKIPDERFDLCKSKMTDFLRRLAKP